MQEVLVNYLGGLSLPRKSVVRLTDCPDMTLDVYRGRKTTTFSISILGVHSKNFSSKPQVSIISVKNSGSTCFLPILL